jgi:nephrocystin-3
MAKPQKISPEIRVFISSTFRDMQAERDHLLKKVFPELRQLCRKRNVVFTEIDLRWGVTEEEAKQGKITRICLDEVDRCRPYFIGILGNRYGSSLDLQTAESDPDLLQKYPWIEQALASQCSLTEIEIIYAALINPSVANSAFFYFCEDRGLTEQFDDVNSSRLAVLKERIRQSGLPVRIYSTPESLGQQVWKDWQYVIDQRYPDDQIPTPLDQQRKAHEAFASTHYRFYIENSEALKRLDEHVTNEEAPLVISGKSGIGKSALLANWSDRYRGQNPNAFLITHYMGAVATGSDHLSLLRRVMEEIRDRYHLTDELPRTAKELEKEFPQWLARVRQDKLILIIDALNQLEESAENLSWLPTRFPSQVRVIISTLEGGVLKNLRKRKYPELNVQPLTLTQREQLISNYLALYTKKLSSHQSQRIARHVKCANPLFLKTVLEELRVFGYFDELDNRIAYYLSSTDLDDLFQHILERMEQDYGAHLLQEVMTLIWSARRGLLETELFDLIDCNRIELSRLLIALDYHLMCGEGLLNFFHDYLQHAVVYRYLTDSSQKILLHQRLAAYFESLSMSERRVEELPWQLKQANNQEKLKGCISDISMFLALSTEAKIFELLGYWLTLKERYNLLNTYQESLGHYEGQAPSAKELANVLNQLGRFIELSGDYEAAEEFYYRALTIQEQLLGTENLVTVASLHNLAKLLHTKGNYDKAETFYRRVQDILAVALGVNHPTTITGLSNLAILLSDKGDYAGASALYQRVLTTHEKLGIDSAAAASLNNLAVFLCKKGNYEEAESNFQKALDIWRQVLGEDHLAVATGLNNMAALLDYKGNYKESERLYAHALVIRERMLGVEHPVTATIFHNRALLLEHTNSVVEAEIYYQRAYSIFQKTLGLRHPDTVLCKSNLDRLLNRQNEQRDINRTDTNTHQHSILALLEETLGTEHFDSTLSIESIIAYPIDIYASRQKLIALLLMSGFFTIVTLFLFSSPSTDSFYAFLKYVGLVFPVRFCFDLKKLISSKPTITISYEGIRDNSSFLSMGLIKWEEIQDIQMFDVYTGILLKYIGIYPKNVKLFLSRCNPIKRFIVIKYARIMNLFYKFDYPIIAVTDLTLPASVENLIWQICKYFNELKPVENINLEQSILSVKNREPQVIEKIRKDSDEWRISVPIDVTLDDWNAVLKNCRINGIEGMTINNINAELSRGGKFVIFQYCIIIFKQSSSIYFIKGDDKAFIKGLRFTLISLFLGWWGLTLIGGRIPCPTGLIHSVKSCITNFRGGKDVTQEVIYTLSQPATFTTKGVNFLNFYTLESFQGTGSEVIWSGFSIAFITYALGKIFDVSESILMPILVISFGVPLWTVAILKIGRFFRVPLIITALLLLFIYVYGALFYLADIFHFVYPHLEKNLVFLILFSLFIFAFYIARWLIKWIFIAVTRINNHLFPDGMPKQLNIASQVIQIAIVSAALLISARLSWSGATSIQKHRVMYIINQGDNHRRLDEYDLALADFNRAIKIDSRSARAYTSQGLLYQVLKDYKRALVDFHLAIQLNPDSVWTIIAHRGETYALLGRYKDALTDYNRAIQLRPNHIPALAGRGQIYALMDNYNAALKDFNQAVQLTPDDVWLLVSRGIIYRRMGYYDKAIVDFNRAITLNPDYMYAIESRAETYLLMRRNTDAQQDRNKLTLLSQAAPIALRGETYLSMERYDEGLREFNRAIDIYPNYVWAIAQRGKTYHSLKQYDKALADLNRAIELYPKYAWAIAQRGKTYCKMKRYQEAVADFNKSVELEPKLSSIQIEAKICEITRD